MKTLNQPTSSGPQLDVFVIGTASKDILHLADGQTRQAAGGAGLYTALAAHKAGANVGLFAPRPRPLPDLLWPAAQRLHWLGPDIEPEQLPRLEIEHHGGGQATLRHASWGAEQQLTPARMPPLIDQVRLVHIAALSSAQRQLEFLQALQARKTCSIPQISVGTYARLVYGDTALVRRLFDQADLFFMNENEAKGLFGQTMPAKAKPGTVLFVTLDAEGALIITEAGTTHVPGHPTTELDPTGAGDTFCGAVLAGLAQGLSPAAAAQQAAGLAAKTVSMVGPGALLDIGQG